MFRKMTNFGQIPTNLICRFHELTKTEIVVISYLYASRNRKTGVCNPSRGAIARAVGISKSHVSPAVKSLDDKEWICEMADGGFVLTEPPERVTESVTPAVTESVTGGLPNRELRVTESVTKGYGIGNSAYKESSEHTKNTRRTQKNNGVAVDGYHVLVKHHCERVKRMSDGKAQGDAIKSLLKDYPVEDCIGCYDYQVSELKPQGWRSRVSWLSVNSEIAEWVIADRPKVSVKNNGNGFKRPSDPGKPATSAPCPRCDSTRFIDEDSETVPCPKCKTEDYEWVKSNRVANSAAANIA